MIASISLDLDNQWSYMKTHGDAAWRDHPSYLDLVTPRILEFLAERDLEITFFVVGQDAALEKNADAITSIVESGHEIGNHSFNHEPWLHLYSKTDLIEEFDKTESALEKLTGARPVGFRGPGFSLSSSVLEVLGDRAYEYDCSTLPTFIGPLARAFFFLRSPDIDDAEREKMKKLFGKFSDGLQTLKPHFVMAGERPIVEIPVTTFPLVKTPIHASYLMYLAGFSPMLARAYWRSAVTACRSTGDQPSLLLHPLDFLSGEDVKELRFFPGMNVAAETKIDLLSYAIGLIRDKYEIVTVREHARRFRDSHQLASETMQLTNA